MKKTFFSILVILFFSCSDRDGKKVSSLSDTVEKDSINLTIEQPDIAEIELATEFFDSIYESFFSDKDYEVVMKAQGGAGDFYGTMRKFKKQNSEISVVIDNQNMGDYGFVRNRYLLKNDSIYAIRTVKSDWSFDKAGLYKLTELYYYFSTDHVVIKSRVEEDREYRDSILSDSIPFIENLMLKDSVLNAKRQELQSAFDYSSLEY